MCRQAGQLPQAASVGVAVLRLAARGGADGAEQEAFQVSVARGGEGYGWRGRVIQVAGKGSLLKVGRRWMLALTHKTH